MYGGQAVGDDRYLIHLVARAGAMGLATLEDRPLPPGDATMVACGAAG